MWVHFQAIRKGVWLLRVFADGKEWGDTWDWGCVAIARSGSVLELALAQTAPTAEQWKAVGRELLKPEWTFRSVRYQRGDGRTVEVPLAQNRFTPRRTEI